MFELRTKRFYLEHIVFLQRAICDLGFGSLDIAYLTFSQRRLRKLPILDLCKIASRIEALYEDLFERLEEERDAKVL